MAKDSAPLTEYRRKRDFDRTPEPRGRSPAGEPGDGGGEEDGLRFVVHRHAATRLHFDLRLELDGVLLSWAVPKGPSLDPEVRALAVQVEDHPLEYGGFEGVIPEEEYGGGTVMLWDRGRWRPEGDPRRGHAKGHLDFRLEGSRLRGRWRLIRMRGEAGEGGRNWLLQKLPDAEAREEAEGERIGEAFTRSVASGRTMAEIAGDADRVWTARGEEEVAGPPLPPPPAAAPGGALPARLRPQLPTLVKRAPEGDRWAHELKLDGYRLLARHEGGEVRLLTRRGFDWTPRFPVIHSALERLRLDGALLDGELVVLARDGTTDFQALQNIMDRGGKGRLVYFLFDLPHYRGRDLSGLPLLERKEVLRELLAAVPGRGVLRYSDHIIGSGSRVYREACRQGAEGIVSKAVDRPYREGRGRDWVKAKCLNRQEFVIGGWTEPGGSRLGFGALLLGVTEPDGRLRYAGRVGTGFTDRSLGEIAPRLEALETDRPPFSNPPTGAEARGVHWTRPRLLAEVEFGSWTDEGYVRHASFRGLREDKEPGEVRREMPGEPPKTARRSRGTGSNRVAGVRLSNPDRVLYPEQGLTKRDLALYYEAVADRLLPHVAGRPLTLVRCPRGLQGQCFYQKHLGEGMPEPVRGIEIEEDDGSALYVGVDDAQGLVTLVQFGVLELHPWGSREDRLDRPDRLIFDLDPGEGVGSERVVAGARRVRRRLDELGLASFVRSTGGKGLHVVVPLVRRTPWDDAKAFARGVATGLARADPRGFVATASKAEREGRIFVDYLRNDRGATAVASWSTRARRGASVATPLAWDELDDLPSQDHYTVRNLAERLDGLERDPWEGFFGSRRSITREMRERAG